MGFPVDLGPDDIRVRLPHGASCVSVDRIEGAGQGRGRAFRTFPAGAPLFADHFPGDPMVPGAAILECMTQAAGLVHGADAGDAPPLRYLVEVSRLRLRRPVRPGECVAIDVSRVKALGKLVKFDVTARVDGAVAAEGEITLSA